VSASAIDGAPCLAILQEPAEATSATGAQATGFLGLPRARRAVVRILRAGYRFDVPGGRRRERWGATMWGPTSSSPKRAADLSTRWCSAYVKIMVMDAAIRNQRRFLGKRTPVLTGERYDESTNRQTYDVFEPHRTDTSPSGPAPWTAYMNRGPCARQPTLRMPPSWRPPSEGGYLPTPPAPSSTTALPPAA
jgi:hypothetical protein